MIHFDITGHLKSIYSTFYMAPLLGGDPTINLQKNPYQDRVKT